MKRLFSGECCLTENYITNHVDDIYIYTNFCTRIRNNSQSSVSRLVSRIHGSKIKRKQSNMQISGTQTGTKSTLMKNIFCKRNPECEVELNTSAFFPYS